MKSISKPLGITITVFCLMAAIVMFKVEILDHQWMAFNRDTNGYVTGWLTPEDAITKDSRWKSGSWDFEILSIN
jgi:hypothetical protein